MRPLALLDSGALSFGRPSEQLAADVEVARVDVYAVRRVEPHPIFDEVSEDDLTFSRGVAGFLARGHHPLPPGADVIIETDDGAAVLYVDRVTSPRHLARDLVRPDVPLRSLLHTGHRALPGRLPALGRRRASAGL